MKPKPTKHLEGCRIREGALASDESDGWNGAFAIPVERWCPGGPATAVIVCSDQGGWDHVRVHIDTPMHERYPTREEIDYVRRLFFRGDECVMQLHVPGSKNINNHPYALHMWRPQNEAIPIPPENFV